jgi:hypothetical protein
MQIFSVFDKAVGAYLPPFYSRSKGEALRSFITACNDEKSQFNVHSGDFVMFHVGVWDDASGLHHPIEPQRVISATECLADPFTRETQVQ